MFDISEATLRSVSVHQLNHSEFNSGVHLSEAPILLKGEKTKELIHHYFLSPLKNKPELYSFTFSNGDAELNPVNILVSQIFGQPNLLHETSQSLAQHLYQCSSHPNIKSGDLYIALFDNIRYEDEMIDAIGIFKSETTEDFLRLIQNGEFFSMEYENGININKLDKGCLIYNLETTEGYLVSSIDRSNGNNEAQYWKENFLQIRPREDEYHHTAQYMNMAQTYVAHQLTEEFDVGKADQIDLLNKSSKYFKEKDSFEAQNFESEVLQSPEIIDSFRQYKKLYENDLEVSLPDEYGISKQAYRKSAKDFKSVLKLDKNFHVYIHGDRKMIEAGVDPDGRKFYKLFYDQES